MNDLFRFVALRAPERTAPKNLTDLGSDSLFQQALAGIHGKLSAPPVAARGTSAAREQSARSLASCGRAIIRSPGDIALWY
jgi:hypothetical protein